MWKSGMAPMPRGNSSATESLRSRVDRMFGFDRHCPLCHKYEFSQISVAMVGIRIDDSMYCSQCWKPVTLNRKGINLGNLTLVGVMVSGRISLGWLSDHVIGHGASIA